MKAEQAEFKCYRSLQWNEDFMELSASSSVWALTLLFPVLSMAEEDVEDGGRVITSSQCEGGAWDTWDTAEQTSSSRQGD